MTSIQALRDDQHDADREVLDALTALREAQAATFAADAAVRYAKEAQTAASVAEGEARQRWVDACRKYGVVL